MVRNDPNASVASGMEKFSGTVRHANGDLSTVQGGSLVNRIPVDHPRYEDMQQDFYASGRDESAETVEGNQSGFNPPPLREADEREYASSSNEPIDGPNFRGPLSETTIRRHPWRENWSGGVNSESSEEYAMGGSVQNAMVQALHEEEGTSRTPAKPVRNNSRQQVRNNSSDRGYEFDSSLTDEMAAHLGQ
jgi:hypothetical protein